MSDLASLVTTFRLYKHMRVLLALAYGFPSLFRDYVERAPASLTMEAIGELFPVPAHAQSIEEGETIRDIFSTMLGIPWNACASLGDVVSILDRAPRAAKHFPHSLAWLLARCSH